MKIFYTDSTLTQLPAAATACKGPHAVCTENGHNAIGEATLNGEIPFAGCNYSTTNTIFNNNKNDANLNGASFSFLPIAPLFKNSFMKQVLRYLQIIVNVFTGALKTFFEGIFTNSIFNKKNKPGELEMVLLSMYNPGLLPFKKNSMRTFLPTVKANSYIVFPPNDTESVNEGCNGVTTSKVNNLLQKMQPMLIGSLGMIGVRPEIQNLILKMNTAN